MPLFSNKKKEDVKEIKPEVLEKEVFEEEPIAQPQDQPEGFVPFNHTYIAPGVALSGSLICSEPLEIEGELSGRLISNNIVHVAESASLNADARINELIVDGHVDGNIEVLSNTVLGNSANFSGSLKTKTFVYSQNAYFNAKLFLPAEGRTEGTTAEDLAKEGRIKFYNIIGADKMRSNESLGIKEDFEEIQDASKIDL